MNAIATLRRSAGLAEAAHRELCELSYNPDEWERIAAAHKASAFVDAANHLKSAIIITRHIAAALAETGDYGASVPLTADDIHAAQELLRQHPEYAPAEPAPSPESAHSISHVEVAPCS